MPKGEEHFWYSSKMRRELADSQPQEPCRLRLWTDGDMVLLSEGGQKYQPMYAQLADGRLVEYTECTPTAETKSSWDDLVYLGPGQIRHPPRLYEETRQVITNMAALVFMKSLG